MRLALSTIPALATFLTMICAVVTAEPRRNPPVVSNTDGSVVFLDGQWSADGETRDNTGEAPHTCTSPPAPPPPPPTAITTNDGKSHNRRKKLSACLPPHERVAVHVALNLPSCCACHTHDGAHQCVMRIK